MYGLFDMKMSIIVIITSNYVCMYPCMYYTLMGEDPSGYCVD